MSPVWSSFAGESEASEEGGVGFGLGCVSPPPTRSPGSQVKSQGGKHWNNAVMTHYVSRSLLRVLDIHAGGTAKLQVVIRCQNAV